jgi:hypothetical protein
MVAAVASSREIVSSRRVTALTLVLASFAVVLLGLGSSAGAASCPAFRVLHADRIGAASFPAGSYAVTTPASGGVTCASASRLFARFLQDYDGVLPRPWTVVAEGSGRASFKQGAALGFSVRLGGGGGGGGGGGNPLLGSLCPGSFTVNASARVGPLLFPKGPYLLYIPARSGISCNRASVLFTRFLSAPGGRLPSPWRLKNQTATFFKPENPTRSAFRVEPLAGS